MSRIHAFAALWIVLISGMVGLSFGDGPAEAPPPPAGGATADQQLEAFGRIRRVASPEHAPGRRSRYRTLLKEIEVPADRGAYGDFCDFGYWSGTQYAGHDDLPPGYWVYLAPKWYIFKEDVSIGSPIAQRPRPWGPEQATGAPDTWPQSGDLQTAWASQTPDGQPEWLELNYSTPVRPTAVLVYETYNPGAVSRVTGFDAKGNEVELWSGDDPTPAGKEKGISVIPVHPDFDISRIRVHVDSPKVPGWNEIDAVGLLDEKGTTHWADSATASSTYADMVDQSTPVTTFVPKLEQRF